VEILSGGAMSATHWAAVLAGSIAVTGCVYAYRTTVAYRYASSGRPDQSYFCYDCQGYRYFDPYYNWCTNYGFVYDWGRNPRVVEAYRSRYVRIKAANRDFGRYTYPEGYRDEPRYRA